MPAVQMEFLGWLATAQLRVPARVHRRTDRSIDLRFPGLATQALAATLIEDSEINVAAIWQRTCWDFLMCNDCVHARQRGGSWVCSTCVSDAPHTGNPVTVYPTRAALWRDHLFQPFAAWVDDELARADALALLRFGRGGTSAHLLPAGRQQVAGATEVIELPLR